MDLWSDLALMQFVNGDVHFLHHASKATKPEMGIFFTSISHSFQYRPEGHCEAAWALRTPCSAGDLQSFEISWDKMGERCEKGANETTYELKQIYIFLHNLHLFLCNRSVRMKIEGYGSPKQRTKPLPSDLALRCPACAGLRRAGTLPLGGICSLSKGLGRKSVCVCERQREYGEKS